MAWWRMSSDEDEHVEPAVRASIVMADVIVASITGFALLLRELSRLGLAEVWLVSPKLEGCVR